MPVCAAFGCTNRTGKAKAHRITFHRFPKNEVQRQKWIQAVRRVDFNPSKYSYLCSSHFKEEDLDRTSLSSVRVREGAVPSVFEAFPSYLKTSKTQRKSSKQRASATTEEMNPTQSSTASATDNLIPAFPDDKTDSLIPAFPDVKTDSVIPAFPDVKTDSIIPAFPDVKTDSVIPAFPDVKTDSLIPSFPDAETDSLTPAFPDIKTDSFTPAFPDVKTDRLIPAFPDVKTDSLIPAFPDVKVTLPSSFVASVSTQCDMDTPVNASLERKLMESEQRMVASRKKIKLLQQSKRRLIKRQAKLAKVIATLRKQNILNTYSLAVLKTCGGGVANLLERKATKGHDKPLPGKYSSLTGAMY